MSQQTLFEVEKQIPQWLADYFELANAGNYRYKQEFYDHIKPVILKNKAYRKEKRKYFDLCLASGDIKVIPLKTIEDYIQEGAALKHCLYTNEYYKKKNSLIL